MLFSPRRAPDNPDLCYSNCVPWSMEDFTAKRVWKMLDQEKFVVPVVQWLNHVWLFATLWTAARQALLSFAISRSLLKFISVESVMVSIWSAVDSSPFAFSLSKHQGLFQWVGSWWSKYWSFSFNISPSSQCSRLISFRIDWFDLHAVQGTLSTLL